MDQNGKSPLLALTVATMLFAALGVVWYNQAPYKDIRPSVQTIPEAPEKIRARLWQDPFQAVLDEMKTRRSTPQPDMLLRKQDETRNSETLDSDTSMPTKHNPLILADQLVALKKDIKEHQGSENRQVTVLGVMVSGGPYAEMVESRTGQRYAVLSAMNVLKYYPEDEAHISYLSILPPHVNEQDTGPSADQKTTLTNIIPFEWLSLEKGNASILLLWLNEDIFTNPLDQFASLQRDLQTKNGNLGWRIIGPPSSGTLLKIYKEILLENKEIPNNMQLYSATATADDKKLLQDVFNDLPNNKKIEFKETYNNFDKNWFYFLHDKIKTKLVRTIQSDKELVKALIDELNNRDVGLTQPSYIFHARSKLLGFFGISSNAKRGHVVLISEWDTVYGRTLPETFKDVIREKLKLKAQEKIRWVHRFSYLRGIDGKLPEEKGGTDKEKKKNDANSKGEADIKKLEEPVGKSQYDYLRRLAERISKLNYRLKSENDESIKAIGVLGNDFYDKFLVLQALGQKFPDRIFFTTDLDANYFHPANIEWTRNLVVASSYGLQLREDLQKDVPPFRNGYQTSVFFATLRAFYNDKNSNNPLQLKDVTLTIKPRIFEIGRNTAIDLTGKPGSFVPINQASAVRGFSKWGWLGFACIMLGFSILAMLMCSSWLSYESGEGIIAGIKQLSTKRKNIILIWLITFLILFFILINVHIIITRYISEEPFSWSEGISVWPTEIIRFIALILSVAFYYLSKRQLKNNKISIDDEFGLEYTLENCQNCQSSATTSNKIIIVNNRWKDYLDRTTIEKRKNWIRCIFALYFIFCIFIIKIFGLPNNPMRGVFSWWFNFILMFITIFAFLYLTFFVLDTIMLCRGFIDQFIQNRSQWNIDSLRKFVQKWTKDPGPFPKNPDQWEKGTAKAALSEYMLVKLIARRTDVVGKLIFYPFIIWSLIIISRLHYFDNWRTPLGLVIVISLIAVLAWVCAVNLRRSAEKLRTAVIKRLDQQLVGIYADDPENKADATFIQYVLNEVKAIKTGAFASYLQQPALQSLLVPLGSISGLKILELLSNLG